jgi:hypothetical protein
MKQYCYYRVRVQVRRGPEWQVKSGTEILDGKEIIVERWWTIGEGDRPEYAGEFALGSKDPLFEQAGIGWIASGDVVVLEEVSREGDAWKTISKH